ncbi:YciI family protein [Sphingomonas sp.]|uniref:YciI family protein n=1 Tax=Sphingomonas sp. TaxID=28214 RepID=UPI0031D87E6E
MHRLTRRAGIAAIALAMTAGTSAAQQQTARPMFATVYRAGPAWKPGVPMKDQGLRDHFFYVKALHERGDIVYAGPMGPDGGLILIHAADQAAADAIAAADPAVKAGIFVGEARDFTPRFTGAGAATAASP